MNKLAADIRRLSLAFPLGVAETTLFGNHPCPSNPDELDATASRRQGPRSDSGRVAARSVTSPPVQSRVAKNLGRLQVHARPQKGPPPRRLLSQTDPLLITSDEIHVRGGDELVGSNTQSRHHLLSLLGRLGRVVVLCHGDFKFYKVTELFDAVEVDACAAGDEEDPVLSR